MSEAEETQLDNTLVRLGVSPQNTTPRCHTYSSDLYLIFWLCRLNFSLLATLVGQKTSVFILFLII
jgi:hypothetical protein